MQGFTTGKRQEKFNKDLILWEYLQLIVGGTLDIEDFLNPGKRPKPMEKWAAIEFLTKKYRIASKEASFELLKKAIKKQKEDCEGKGESHGWKNLLPWKGETESKRVS